MAQAKAKCDVLFEQLRDAEDKVHQLKQEWKAALEEWQRVCSHEYQREDNGDYHKPGYYYTCKHCAHFRTSKP